MIDTQAIRNKILNLAMRGQLTKQISEDGTARELIDQIQIEKNALINSGRIKKGKKLPQITDFPFEIPKSWSWVRWGSLSFRIQYGYNAPAKEKGRIKMVRITDIQDNRVIWKNVPFCDIEEGRIDEYRIKSNNILFARTGGTVGKSYLVENVDEDAVFAGYLIRTDFSSMLCAKYMKYFMESQLYWKQLQDGTTATAQPNCNAQTLSKMVVPLPPVSEQTRIVEKIETAFEILDKIDALQEQYISNQEALKSKLIDAAIQGQLTEQLPEDGTAEELYEEIQKAKLKLIKEGKLKKTKALPEIIEDEIQFDIPDNWKWVRISDVIDVRDGTHDSPKYHHEGIPLVTSKNISSGKLCFDDVKLISADDARKINERSQVDDGDILFAMIGSIGNPVIVHKDRDFCIKNVALFKNFAPMHISMEYFYWFLIHEQFVLRKNARGGLQPFVSLKVLRNHILPLPPLSEQIRIAERLYNFMDAILGEVE